MILLTKTNCFVSLNENQKGIFGSQPLIQDDHSHRLNFILLKNFLRRKMWSSCLREPFHLHMSWYLRWTNRCHFSESKNGGPATPLVAPFSLTACAQIAQGFLGMNTPWLFLRAETYSLKVFYIKMLTTVERNWRRQEKMGRLIMLMDWQD